MAATLVGCVGQQTYPCAQDVQCEGTDRGSGQCRQGWCAYEDDACESGLRFSSNAGAGLADACTPSGADASSTADGSSSDPSRPGATEADSDDLASSSTSAGPCGPCLSPPSACYQAVGSCDPDRGVCVYAPSPLGASCDDADACTPTSSCDGLGACEGSESIVCDEPPSTCFAPSGVCDAQTGTCDYALLPAGSDCDDGDACTVEDTCADDGMCISGEVCPVPPGEPCTVATCEAGACAYDTLADGSSCGGAASLRCCGGSCVDISSDAANCGACGLACDGGLQCESVAATSSCESAPADVTGRCRCTGFNAQCPGGQICRTVSPFNDRCTPNGASDCPGPSSVVSVNLCPDYCAY